MSEQVRYFKLQPECTILALLYTVYIPLTAQSSNYKNAINKYQILNFKYQELVFIHWYFLKSQI